MSENGNPFCNHYYILPIDVNAVVTKIIVITIFFNITTHWNGNPFSNNYSILPIDGNAVASEIEVINKFGTLLQTDLQHTRFLSFHSTNKTCTIIQ